VTKLAMLQQIRLCLTLFSLQELVIWQFDSLGWGKSHRDQTNDSVSKNTNGSPLNSFLPKILFRGDFLEKTGDHSE
jgi:hypothetical protein